MTSLAVAYTVPWDRFLISQNIWFYGSEIVSAWILGIPLGEYLFFIIQTITTGLWFYYSGFETSDKHKYQVFGSLRYTTPFISITSLGIYLVSLGQTPVFYLGAILAWAGPIITLQWAFGAQKLLEQKKNLIKGIGIPNLYLWIIDAIAIRKGLWTITEGTRTGIELLGLPIEEAIFFLATNTMVVQGLLLYEWHLEKHRNKD